MIRSLILVIFFFGCSSRIIRPEYPEWVTLNYNHSVVSCSKIQQNDILTAKKIAQAKAQSKITYRGTVSVRSSSSLTKSASKDDSRAEYNSSVYLDASSVLTDYKIQKSEILEFSGYDELCIIYGPKNEKIK